MALTETSNERSVDGIGLGPQELALSECFNASWINNANPFLEAVKVQRQRFPNLSRGFEAQGVPVSVTCPSP